MTEDKRVFLTEKDFDEWYNKFFGYGYHDWNYPEPKEFPIYMRGYFILDVERGWDIIFIYFPIAEIGDYIPDGT